jgi:mannose-6-phosphate isomerase-like protein (cupin superfamily)
MSRRNIVGAIGLSALLCAGALVSIAAASPPLNPARAMNRGEVIAPCAETRPQDLIGGIGLTHLTVYDQRPAPDGLMSGSPHVHALTDEGYYVVSGRGRVELHDLKQGFRSVNLVPGTYLQFPPDVLHRLVSTEHLVVLAVMGNAGLAERGDARIYFGKAVDDDPAEYARLVDLAKTKGLEGALDRRDAAVLAYIALLDLWTKNRPAYFAELGRFIGFHARAAAGMKAVFADVVENGPVAWAARFRNRLAGLPRPAAETSLILLHEPTVEPTLGMCGLLRPVTNLETIPSGPNSAPAEK